MSCKAIGSIDQLEAGDFRSIIRGAYRTAFGPIVLYLFLDPNSVVVSIESSHIGPNVFFWTLLRHMTRVLVNPQSIALFGRLLSTKRAVDGTRSCCGESGRSSAHLELVAPLCSILFGPIVEQICTRSNPDRPPLKASKLRCTTPRHAFVRTVILKTTGFDIDALI